MRLKTTNLASEYDSFNQNSARVKNLVYELLNHKILGLTKGLLIPDDLIAELESYAQRNSLNHTVSDLDEGKIIFCPKCLKAHMLKTSEKMGISPEGREFLSLFIKGDIGHNGYYLDEDELIEIC